MSSRFESVTGVVDLPFPEYDAPPSDPTRLVRDWITAAVDDGVREPLALSLATTGPDGRASNRIVAVLEIIDGGLVFTTHSTSRKAREIAENGWAAGLFYWRETARQLSVAGPVVPLSDEDNERLWAARAPALHPMTTASRQSDPLDDPAVLRAEADRLAAAGTPLPRPARFVGYRLEPHSVEFWSCAESRLHRRLRYDRTTTGWRVARLQP